MEGISYGVVEAIVSFLCSLSAGIEGTVSVLVVKIEFLLLLHD